MDTDVFIRQAHSLMESACLEMNLINENSSQERQVLILFEAGYQSRKGNFACRADCQAVLYAASGGKAKQISARFVAALHQKPSGKQLGQCPGIGRWAELSQGVCSAMGGCKHLQLSRCVGGLLVLLLVLV